MLKVDIHEEKQNGRRCKACMIESGGTLSEISADISEVVLQIYARLQKQTPASAALFRYGIETAFSSNSFWQISREMADQEGLSALIIRNQ